MKKTIAITSAAVLLAVNVATAATQNRSYKANPKASRNSQMLADSHANCCSGEVSGAGTTCAQCCAAEGCCAADDS